MGSFGNVCRLCCGEETNLIQIFSSYDLRMQLADKIKKYLDVEILIDDHLPKNVCGQCLTRLKEVEEFIELTQKAQRTLDELHIQTQVAKQIAEGDTTFSDYDDPSNPVMLLLLQEELKRLKRPDPLISMRRSSLNSVDRNSGSQRRKGQNIPVAVARKSKRSSLPCDNNDGSQQYPKSLKSEPLDQETSNLHYITGAAEDKTGSEESLLTSADWETSEHENTNPLDDDSHVGSSKNSMNNNSSEALVVPDKNANDTSNKIECNNNSNLVELAETCDENTIAMDGIDEFIREPIVKIETEGQEVELEVSGDEGMQSRASKSASFPMMSVHFGRCSICEAPFYALSSLLLHQHMQHSQEPKPQNPLMCLYCNLTFRDLHKLVEHTALKHGGHVPEPMTCTSSVVKGSGSLKARRKIKGRHYCHECCKTFPSKRGLALHQRVHSKTQKAASLFKSKVKRARKKVRGTVRCGMCGDTASSFPQLRTHVAAVHKDTDEDCSAPYMCTHCDKCYSAPASLVQHRAKHGVDAIMCSICCKSYHPKYLRKHMIVHQEHRPHACDQCDKAFKDVEGLRHHKLKHRPDELKYKFSCHVCGHRFMNNGALQVHIKVVHEQVKDFSCQFCDRKFGSKSTAEIHERTHTGEKPFCCEACGWRCNSKGKLKVHMRVHSDLKPYECKTCGKRTRSRNEMRQHELIHTDTRPYPCSHCEKRFRSTSQLKIHVRQHTGERPYQCPHCTRNFCDFANYSKHMHRVHKKEFEVSGNKKQYKGVPGKDLASAGKMQGPVHVNAETVLGGVGLIDLHKSCGSSAVVSSSSSSTSASSDLISLALNAMPGKCSTPVTTTTTSSNNGNNIASLVGILDNDSNDSLASTGSQDLFKYPQALQLRLQQLTQHEQQQQHQLLQLQLQSHQQASSGGHVNSASTNNIQGSGMSLHHQSQNSHPQQQQSLALQKIHHHAHQQQHQQQLLPLNLPPPPQAHQRLPHSLLHPTHSTGPLSSHHLQIPSSSLLSTLTDSVTNPSSSSTAHHHSHHPVQLQHSASAYSNTQQQNNMSQLPLHMQQQLSHHQAQQQQQLLQHQQQQYQNIAFTGPHLNNSSSYDPFRLTL